MNILLHYSGCVGEVTPPTSKSYAQRAIAIAAASGGGRFVLQGYEPSADIDSALKCARDLGVNAEILGNTLILVASGKVRYQFVLDCGESGLSARMFGIVAALLPLKVTIKGKGSILNRPMRMLADALIKMNKGVKTVRGCLPLTMWGKMGVTNLNISGTESSQVVTGLLIALPKYKSDTVLTVADLTSVPYVQMTLDILAHYGIKVENRNFNEYRIKGNQPTLEKEYVIEKDWSAAAMLLVAGAIGGKITVKGLNPNSAQADRAILEALKLAGAKVTVSESEITCEKHLLKAFNFNATNCPDLFPPLAALAACCEGTSTIKGVNRLKHKESDRALVLQQEFGKLGILIKNGLQNMSIKGGKVQGWPVNSHNDHRIAMALALLNFCSERPVVIKNCEAVNKSYPRFFEDLVSIGIKRK